MTIRVVLSKRDLLRSCLLSIFENQKLIELQQKSLRWPSKVGLTLPVVVMVDEYRLVGGSII